MTAKAAPSLCRVVALISGNGSNLQALIDRSQSPHSHYHIVLVLSNRPNAYGLQRAQRAGIATAVVDHTQFSTREHFEQSMLHSIERYNADLIVLAGFMRVLTPLFVRQCRGKLLNIHPSCLPTYPGLDTHRQVLMDGQSEHGATVHFVVEQLDAGPCIVQSRIAVRSNDTPQTLHMRVLATEHRIYPFAVQLFARGQFYLSDNQVVCRGTPIPFYGKVFHLDSG